MAFTVQQFSGTNWVIPTGSPNPSQTQGPGLSFTLTGVGLPGSVLNNAPTTATNGFSLTWNLDDPNQPVANLSVSTGTLFPNDRSTLVTNWNSFVAELEKLEPVATSGTQYVIYGGRRVILQELARRMPLPLDEVRHYLLGFAPSGNTGNPYLDLQIGTRLKVSSAYYGSQAHSAAGDQFSTFVGAGESYYYLQSASDGNGISFSPFMDGMDVATGVNTIEQNTIVAGGLIDLAAQPQKNYLRLYYPQASAASFPANTEASAAVAENATLISTYSKATLPSSPPTTTNGINEPGGNALPIVFFGRSAVIPEIAVFVNGDERYVPVGTTVRNLMEQDSPIQTSTSLLSFTRYLGQLASPVLWTASGSESDPRFDMLVLPGDQLRWINGDDFGLLERLEAIFNVSAPATASDLVADAITSYGSSAGVEELPDAMSMAIALSQMSGAPYSYTVTDIAPALHANYTVAPFTGTHCLSNGQLTFALYAAGYDYWDVSDGLITALGITANTPSVLVSAMVTSNVGYTCTQVAQSIAKWLLGELGDTPQNVAALLVGSYQTPVVWSPTVIAEAIVTAYNPALANNMTNIATALIGGSANAHNANSGIPAYSVSTVSTAMIAAAINVSQPLTFDTLVEALSAACYTAGATGSAATQKTGFPDLQSIATGAYPSFNTGTPTDVATAFFDASVKYDLTQVASATYAITTYPAPFPSNGVITAVDLGTALKDCGATPTITETAIALQSALNYNSNNADQLGADLEKIFQNSQPAPSYADIATAVDVVNDNNETTSEIVDILEAAFNFAETGTDGNAMKEVAAAIVKAEGWPATPSQHQLTHTARVLYTKFNLSAIAGETVTSQNVAEAVNLMNAVTTLGQASTSDATVTQVVLLTFGIQPPTKEAPTLSPVGMQLVAGIAKGKEQNIFTNLVKFSFYSSQGLTVQDFAFVAQAFCFIILEIGQPQPQGQNEILKLTKEKIKLLFNMLPHELPTAGYSNQLGEVGSITALGVGMDSSNGPDYNPVNIPLIAQGLLASNFGQSLQFTDQVALLKNAFPYGAPMLILEAMGLTLLQYPSPEDAMGAFFRPFGAKPSAKLMGVNLVALESLIVAYCSNKESGSGWYNYLSTSAYDKSYWPDFEAIFTGSIFQICRAGLKNNQSLAGLVSTLLDQINGQMAGENVKILRGALIAANLNQLTPAVCNLLVETIHDTKLTRTDFTKSDFVHMLATTYPKQFNINNPPQFVTEAIQQLPD